MVCAVVFVWSATVFTQVGSRPAPAGPAGRYVAITPPVGGESASWVNFLWALDTQTGQVTAYRVASLKGENDKHPAFIYEELQSLPEFYRTHPDVR